jgi:pimeloyl-ACP methyl ester carboxylesterase
MFRTSLHTVLRNRIPQSSLRLYATSSRSHQTLDLSDGRKLGFAEYGSPDGKPVFYFHGFPSSRLEAQPIDDIAQRCGVRLIALDRPGFGLSSPKPDYRIIDWPKDVAELAKAKKLTKFSVFGLSGGGPFALACAYALPKRALTSVGLFASAPPWAAGVHHVDKSRRIMRFCAMNCPDLLAGALNMFSRSVRWLVLTGPAIKRIGKWLDAQDAKDKPETKITKSHAERVEGLVNMLLDEPFRQGASGTVHEAKLLTSKDWGFKLEDVDYDRVQIWHGVKDINANIAMIRYMADRIPNSELTEFEEDTHYTMYKHIEPALRSLVNAEEKNEGQIRNQCFSKRII